MRRLLAVDLGLRMGMALYEQEEETLRLAWFRSHHFANRQQWKKGVYQILVGIEDLESVWVEGDKLLGETWQRLAEKRGARFFEASAETWRADILLPREQRSGAEAKRYALQKAGAIIDLMGEGASKGLRDDAAEAILFGLWAVAQEGWAEIPAL
ncbi:MAG: hypothetical protein H6727_12370 [Myxococcales bacterium]|nr:hypothetical protein [Myxococcales bacterium]